jgi:hypothetical protein
MALSRASFRVSTRIPPQRTSPAETARFRIGLALFFVHLLSQPQDDQAGMVSGPTSKREKVIAVAADEDQSLRTRVAKDFFIGCGDWQHRA